MFALIFLASDASGAWIDAAYPLASRFRNSFEVVERVSVRRANVERVVKTTTDAGTIVIRRGKNDGRYLVSIARGSYVEQTKNGTATAVAKRLSIDGRSEFDALGYAKGRAADPASLIPIFPGRRVETGDVWSVTSPVHSYYGDGVAHYRYRVVQVRRNRDGHVLATFTVAMTATLAQPRAASKTLATASGSIIWDCSEHERAFSRTVLTYATRRNGELLIDKQSESDRFTLIPSFRPT